MRRRPVDEEIAVKLDAAGGIGIELHHPALETIGIKLRIDRAVERVGEIHAPAVTADLDHLRSAIQRTIRLWMSGARDNASDPDLSSQPGVEGIRYVILLEIAGAPAGNIEETIIHREIDIRDERRHRLERLESRRQLILGG